MRLPSALFPRRVNRTRFPVRARSTRCLWSYPCHRVRISAVAFLVTVLGHSVLTDFRYRASCSMRTGLGILLTAFAEHGPVSAHDLNLRSLLQCPLALLPLSVVRLFIFHLLSLISFDSVRSPGSTYSL